ncbi:MAG: hypothetical protein OEV40_30990 [Acidimicrobiia bacterium]|nr:hypothetical protein [Acidimicrobiia bacterium]
MTVDVGPDLITASSLSVISLPVSDHLGHSPTPVPAARAPGFWIGDIGQFSSIRLANGCPI